ncbi:hypothetical protein TURU_013443 [Turdus rufiventris]|nr:hypothetical protein TURU_013443 [Turdus rufiventris]
MVLVHVGYLVLPVFGSVRNRVKLEQELFKSQSASEGNGGGDASGEVSIKPGSFHNLQAENTTHLPVRKGAVNLMQITTLLVVVC